MLSRDKALRIINENYGRYMNVENIAKEMQCVRSTAVREMASLAEEGRVIAIYSPCGYLMKNPQYLWDAIHRNHFKYIGIELEKLRTFGKLKGNRS